MELRELNDLSSFIDSVAYLGQIQLEVRTKKPVVGVDTGQPLRPQSRGEVECGCGVQTGILGHPLFHSSLDLFLHQSVSVIGW